MDQVEGVVVGAGVVGLAVARALAREGTSVLVIEAAPGPGLVTSGRGSGVIHAGLYYAPGSLKARLCVAGGRTLAAFAAARSVPHRRLGKLVVATTCEEDAALAGIAATAAANGVAGVRRLTRAAALALEPALACTSALLSPDTGIIDVPALLRALRDEAEAFGAVCAFRASLLSARRARNGFTLAVGGATPMRLACRLLVNAAGHGAQDVARGIEGLPAASIPPRFYAKGHYFALRGAAPFSRLIYPVPVPGGVGTHLTFDMAGAARFGPDVEWVASPSAETDPARAAAFAADIRRWWPGLPDGALAPSPAGVRPKISGPGEPGRDFLIAGAADHGVPGLVNLFGIESPGVTASLAIGDHVRDLLAG